MTPKLQLLLLGALCILWGVATAAEPSKPNLVIILTDDMGYADLKAFGGSEIPTPHLDRLEAEETKFTSAYTVVPICVPSRMGIMSGKFAARFGVFNNRTQAIMSNNGIIHSKTGGSLTALMIYSAC